MRSFTILFLFFFVDATFSKDYQSKLVLFYQEKWPQTVFTIQDIIQGKIIVSTIVKSSEVNQSLTMQATALHQVSCTKALRKLSLFENYQEWISFISESKYDDTNKRITFKADHLLMPFPMIVHVDIQRPTSSGIYPFLFPTGMYKGLKGQLHVVEIHNRCLFYSTSFWEGPKSKVPDFALELFTKTLTKLAGETLLRISRF
jgi:hypothetical protein